MIFPGDFKDAVKRPEIKLSWVILFLNVFIFIGIQFFFDTWPKKEFRKKLYEENFINTVNEMYLQTLDPVEKSSVDRDAYKIYSRALKDRKFWGRVSGFPFVGDQVEIKESRAVITEFYKDYLKSPYYYFGLGSLEVSPWSWLTYQFVHVSFVHLLGNIILIFLLVAYLEKSVSSLWIGATYIFSGFAGGVSFLFFDSVSAISVVGASASASGLLSFLLITQVNKLMPWGYLIAPVKNGFGQIYLPVFFIFPIFLVTDLLSLLIEPSGVVSNVAVSAHVGGFFMGMLIGIYYLLFLRSESATHRIFGHDDRLHELL